MTRPRRRLLLGLILAAGAAVYAPNLTHPFQYDDENKIVNDPRIRNPLSYFRAFREAGYKEETTRLTANLTYALNYRLFGLNPAGYNATNLLVHLLNAWLVFRLGRTFLRRLGDRSAAVPLLAAALFALHPLNTEAVNYANARPNLLCTTFYLSALPALVRAVESPGKTRWTLFAVLLLATLLSKEIALSVVVMGPLLLFWLGRRPSPRLLGMGALALGLAGLTGAFTKVFRILGEGGVSGFLLNAINQSNVLAAYFGLALLPLPRFLNVDHDVAHLQRVAVGPLLSFLAVAAIIILAVRLRSRFVFATFFLLWPFVAHAPTWLVPRWEVMVEYRTYLPMVGVCLFLAWALNKGIGTRPAIVCLVAALAAGTVVRNRVWRTSLALWEDAAAKSPGKARPHVNLGVVLAGRKRIPEAIDHLREAVRVKPDSAEARFNLGLVLADHGSVDEGTGDLNEALRLNPSLFRAHHALGRIAGRQGRTEEEQARYEEALRIAPAYAEAHNNLGALLAKKGKFEEAAGHLRKAVDLKPDYADARVNLGNVLGDQGKREEAVAEYRKALRQAPENVPARHNLAGVLAELGRIDEALAFYAEAVRMKPDFVEARLRSAEILMQSERIEEAVHEYSEVLKIRPDCREAREGMETALRRRK